MQSKRCIEKLDIMTAGSIPPNLSEVLFSETAEKMGRKYALIIVDLPPICVVIDAVTLSKDIENSIYRSRLF